MNSIFAKGALVGSQFGHFQRHNAAFVLLPHFGLFWVCHNCDLFTGRKKLKASSNIWQSASHSCKLWAKTPQAGTMPKCN